MHLKENNGSIPRYFAQDDDFHRTYGMSVPEKMLLQNVILNFSFGDRKKEGRVKQVQQFR